MYLTACILSSIFKVLSKAMFLSLKKGWRSPFLILELPKSFVLIPLNEGGRNSKEEISVE